MRGAKKARTSTGEMTLGTQSSLCGEGAVRRRRKHQLATGSDASTPQRPHWPRSEPQLECVLPTPIARSSGFRREVGLDTAPGQVGVRHSP